MGLFSRRPQTWPPTSYGYSAPTGALARGWTCFSESCGTTEYELVRRWPKACSRCGSPTDPRFEEPWAHEAQGVEMRFMAAREEGGGFYRDQVFIWDYRDAVVRGDDDAAARARAAGQAHTEQRLASDGAWWGPGTISYPIFLAAMEAGRLGDAGGELAAWTAVVPTTDLEANNGRRTNIRSVIDASVRFLETPRSASHPTAAQLRERLPHWAHAAREVLTADNRDGLRRLGVF